MLRALAKFWRSKSGLAAVEFGLIAPVMGVMLVGTIEVCNALECKQKVTSIASTVADLVAQEKSVTSTDMTNIFAAANQLIYPFPSSGSSIVVSSILSDGNGNGLVGWSKAQNGTALTTGAAVVVPTGLMTASACAKNACSVILTQVSYAYSSPMGKLFIGSNNMVDYFYARPRKSATITYSGS
jgi:Flp pilus assembly protein TadG